MVFPCHGKNDIWFFARAEQTCCRSLGGAYIHRKISDGKQNCVFLFLQERDNARKLYTCFCIAESFFALQNRPPGGKHTHVVRAIKKPFLNYFPNFKTAPSGNTVHVERYLDRSY